MVSPISGLQNGNPVTDQTGGNAAPKDALTSKDTFLKLLVEQIKHQNPLNPSDGIEFLTQLAQFTGLEQSMEMSKDLTAIRAVLEAGAAPQTPAPADTSTGTP